MTVSKIRLDCIVSDSIGVSGKRVMKYFSGLPFDEKTCKELIDPRVKAEPEEVMEYIRGFEIADEERFKMKHVYEHLDFIGTTITTFDEEINLRSAKFQKQIGLLSTIPGIKRRTAISIIAEIGTDMSVFGSSRRLCSWAGLVPADNESANKKKSTRCSNGGRYIKPKLVECAFAAVKNKKNPYFMNKYKKLVKRKGKKKAIIAIARMMLTCIYHILDKNEAFAPSDYKAIINQEP